MEKNRKIKVLSIFFLIVALFAMTLGFAAFSANLVISSSAVVTPNADDFKLAVSPSFDEPTPENNYFEPIIVGDARADNVFATVEGNKISAHFDGQLNSPGSSITYRIYLHNLGKYVVYLNTLKFNYVSGMEVKKNCTIPEGSTATPELVAEACKGIKIFIRLHNSVGWESFTDDFTFNWNIGIEPGTAAAGEFKVIYSEDAVRADGPFNVEFGDIELTYSSAL